jgi:hypothetical protein
MRSWYQRKTLDERREIIRKRDPEKVKRADRVRYYRDYEKRRAASDAYQAKNKDRVNELSNKWVKKNPEKRKAQIMVGNAIRGGKLVRGLCEVNDQSCGGRVEAHHDDYSKPLEVRWLCRKHHAKHHRKYKEFDGYHNAGS